jgi:hypothetical protein
VLLIFVFVPSFGFGVVFLYPAALLKQRISIVGGERMFLEVLVFPLLLLLFLRLLLLDKISK